MTSAFSETAAFTCAGARCITPLMPVWMLNTKWHGKDFLFAMNGQTGSWWATCRSAGEVLGAVAAIAVPCL